MQLRLENAFFNFIIKSQLNVMCTEISVSVSQYVKKKNPMYSTMKEDTVWSFDRLQSYIDEKYAKEKELPENWVYTAFTVSKE